MISRVLIALFFISLCSVRQSSAETLAQFIADVTQANPDLDSLRKQAVAEKFRARSSGYWDDLFFGLGPDEVPENDRRGGMLRYQISQTIPFPGRLSVRRDSAASQAQVADAGARSAEREVTVVAAQLYARAFYTQRAMETNQEQRQLLNDLLESTRARYRAGSGDHHELILAKVEVSTLDADRLRLLRELKSLKAKMNEMKAEPPEKAISLEDISIAEELPSGLDAALKNQPELLGAAASLDAAQAELRGAKLSYFPDIVLQGMYMKPRSMSMDAMGEEVEEPAQWGAMVGFSIPIFFYGKQANLSSAAQASKEASLAQKRSLENRLRTEWTEASAQVETAEDLVRLYKKEVIPNTELAAKTGRSAYVSRRLPLSQFIEILRAQRTQRLELTAAEIDLSMAKLRMIHLLSRAPQMRIAPMRPTLFGGGSMSPMTGSSDAVSMGSGMRAPVLQKKSKGSAQPSESSNMEGM